MLSHILHIAILCAKNKYAKFQPYLMMRPVKTGWEKPSFMA